MSLGPLLISCKHHKEHLTSSQSISNLCTQMQAHSPHRGPKAGGLGWSILRILPHPHREFRASAFQNSLPQCHVCVRNQGRSLDAYEPLWCLMPGPGALGRSPKFPCELSKMNSDHALQGLHSSLEPSEQGLLRRSARVLCPRPRACHNLSPLLEPSGWSPPVPKLCCVILRGQSALPSWVQLLNTLQDNLKY